MAGNPWGSEESDKGSAATGGREWQLIEKAVMASVEEQRRSRRWGIFFKALTFLYIFGLIIFLSPGNIDEKAVGGPHTAVVDVYGEIADGAEANADSIIEGLRDAFKAPHSRAVIMRINSPGGSPVQSAYVYDEIMRLKAAHKDKKLYAVITDVGASGAYYMASAADQIYVNPASLVGSIGVIMGGFGLEELIKKMGIERRVMTAGEHKAIGDPFAPVKPEEREHIQKMLDTIHQQFITAVRQGRGQRLKETPDMFSGLFWTGEQAVELGLADGFGSVDQVARNIVKAEETIDYTPMPNPFDNMLKKLGVSAGTAMAQNLAPTLQVR